MKDLVVYVVKALVDEPESVSVDEILTEKTIILELKVAPSDVGKVIGRQGRIIGAIRTILNAAAAKTSKRVMLEVLD